MSRKDRQHLPGEHLVARWSAAFSPSSPGSGKAQPRPSSSHYQYLPVARVRYQPFFIHTHQKNHIRSAPLFSSLENLAEWAVLNPDWPVHAVYDWSKRRWASYG